MDDEDTLLPRKLQAALEQALERKNELIAQDSDSDSDDGELSRSSFEPPGLGFHLCGSKFFLVCEAISKRSEA